MTIPENLVCFAHGKESGPWGTKITHLAEVARVRGFEVISPDYSGSHDPHERVAQLQKLAPRARRLVLVGSSMGGYVSAMACEAPSASAGDLKSFSTTPAAALKPQALFLMAPALYFPGWDEEPSGCPELTVVVHGWKDEIVPVERSITFASTRKSALHLLDSGHTLTDQLPLLSLLFDELLQTVVTHGKT